MHDVCQRAPRAVDLSDLKVASADSTLHGSRTGLVIPLVVSGKTRLSLNPEMNPDALI